MRIAIFLVIFFIISALMIVSNNNLSLYKNENLPKFSQLYIQWLGSIYQNIITTSEYTIRLDWLP
jgi:hypothetical protein